MTTRQEPGGDQTVVDLAAMLVSGTDEARVAFHLMNIDFHAKQINAEGNPVHMLMLLDMLTQHAAPLAEALEQMSGDFHVAQDQLIVPGNVQRAR